jgi:hypothetical protein
MAVPGVKAFAMDDAAEIAQAFQSLPLAWHEVDGVPVAKTLDGRDVALGTCEDYAALGEVGFSQMIDRLNASLSVGGAAGTGINITIGDLAKGVAGAIAGKIALAVIDAVFPSKPLQSYFDDLYNRLKQMVHEEVTQTVINKTNGDVNGAIAFVRNTYLPRQRAGAKKKGIRGCRRRVFDDGICKIYM